jgi:hypothetical protein
MSLESQVAYTNWKNRNKVDLQVRTDEQMFMIGFEQCQEVIKELTELIFDMEKEQKRLEAQIKKLKKEAKNAKEV